MPAATVSEQEFIDLYNRFGSATKLARHLGISTRAVMDRASRIESTGVTLYADDPRSPRYAGAKIQAPVKLAMDIQDGVVLVGSDAHYYPGEPTTAHRAFVRFAKELKPRLIVQNGDVFDGGQISRWPRIGWDSKPTVKQEIEAVNDRMGEIEAAAPKSAKVWTLGNHDARFETRLAQVASEYEGVKGFHLKDHFLGWKPCWAIWVNDDVVIKHRFKSGIHAVHNNTMWAGKTMVTGHLHSLKVSPLSDYNGTRWGVDTGTLADPYGPQFIDYTESNPVNWRSGFVVLTFHKGRLLWPEVCAVVEDGLVDFRGHLISV